MLFKDPEAFGDLQRMLQQRNIPGLKRFLRPYNSGARGDCDRYIFAPGHLTLPTVYGAKGHDAHVVFVLGTDLFPASGDDNKGRAAFYVAATRAKHLLYVTGVEQPGHTLLHEALGVAKLFGRGAETLEAGW